VLGRVDARIHPKDTDTIIRVEEADDERTGGTERHWEEKRGKFVEEVNLHDQIVGSAPNLAYPSSRTRRN
jgi:hypothetical protein